MKIIKLNNRVWKFEDVEIGEFSPSKFTINRLNNKVTVVYFNNLKSKTYDVADCEIYDIGAIVPFTTTNGDDFMLKLEELNCPCFQKDETTIIGGDDSLFKKKSESDAFVDGSLPGEKAVIQLRPQGNSFYAIASGGLVSIDGFGLDLITGNPSAEPPYNGKDLIIQNLNAEPFDLVHEGDGMATAKFRFFNEQNLTVPPQGVVLLKYFTPYCEVIFKSWSDGSSEEKAYLISYAGAATTTLTANQYNLHHSTFVSENPFGALGLTLGVGIAENNLNQFSDKAVPLKVPFNAQVEKIICSYIRAASEITSPTDIVIKVMSDTKYNQDMQWIADFNLVSNTFLASQENTVELTLQSHLDISEFGNIRWSARSNNATDQQFRALRMLFILRKV